MPQVRPTRSPPGTALLVRCEVGGTQGLKGDKTSNPKPGLLDTRPSDTQTRAGLPLHRVPKAMQEADLQPFAATQACTGASDKRTMGPEFQLKHAHHSQAGLSVKASARGRLGGSFTSPLSYLQREARPSAQHRPGRSPHLQCPDPLHSCSGVRTCRQPHEPPALLRGCAPSP